MVDRLNRLRRLTFLLATGMLVGPVHAESSLSALPDPTRPPAAFYEPANDAGEVTGPVLQSVVIPVKGRPVAVISGQQVTLGGRYGESRLIRLSESEAVLQGPAGALRLPLTSGITKTPIMTKSPAVRRVQRGSKP